MPGPQWRSWFLYVFTCPGDHELTDAVRSQTWSSPLTAGNLAAAQYRPVKLAVRVKKWMSQSTPPMKTSAAQSNPAEGSSTLDKNRSSRVSSSKRPSMIPSNDITDQSPSSDDGQIAKRSMRDEYVVVVQD